MSKKADTKASDRDFPYFVLNLKPDPNHPYLIEVFRTPTDPLKKCHSCGNEKGFIELEPYLIRYICDYRSDDISKTVPLSKRFEEFENFSSLMSRKHLGRQFQIKESIFLKPIHEPNCELTISDDDHDYIVTENTIFLSEFVKIRLDNKYLYAHLKLDPETLKKFPQMDKICLDYLCKKMEAQYFNNAAVEEFRCPKLNDNVTGNTFKFPEYEVPPGFALKLSQNQKRNLSWMSDIEDPKESEINTIYHTVSSKSYRANDIKFRIAKTPYFLDPKAMKITDSPKTNPHRKIKLNGGVLLDKENSFTALALIHSRPCTSIPSNYQGRQFSKATLVVCPRNNFIQWIDEARRCNPNFKILVIPDENLSMSVYEKRQMRQNILRNSDIVFINYSTCYYPENVNLFENICFYRIIFDQYDSPSDGHNSVSLIPDLKAVYIWALKSGNEDMKFPIYLPELEKLYNENGNRAAFWEISDKYFKNKMFPHRKHFADKFIELKPCERRIMNKKLPLRSEGNLKFFEYDFAIVGFTKRRNFDSIDELAKSMIDSHKGKLKSIENRLVPIRNLFDSYNHNGEHDENKEDALQALKSGEKSLMDARRTLRFTKKVIKNIKTDKKSVECLICHSDFAEINKLGIFHCGHVYCYECIKEWMKQSRVCPLCRTIYVFEEINLDGDSLEKHSSKFIFMLNYIDRQLQCKYDSKIIIFEQFSKLANLLEEHLKLANREFVRLIGSAQERHDTIVSFRTLSSVKILLTCYEDGISGVHIPEANHLILYHPISQMSRNTQNDYSIKTLCSEMLAGGSAEIIQLKSNGTFEMRL